MVYDELQSRPGRRPGFKNKKGNSMPKSTFQRVYDIVCCIPPGTVTTYGQIARLLGNPRMSQVVGFALHVNPEPGVIPCHRVVNRFGGLADAFAFGGINRQRQLLEQEGVTFTAEGNVDLVKHMWYGEEYIIQTGGPV